MNTPDDTDYTQWTPPKPNFSKICVMYNLYYDDLLTIADAAGVTKEMIEAMYIGHPVSRTQAVAVLKAFSDFVQHSWTMDNVSVPTLPESEDEKP